MEGERECQPRNERRKAFPSALFLVEKRKIKKKGSYKNGLYDSRTQASWVKRQQPKWDPTACLVILHHFTQFKSAWHSARPLIILFITCVLCGSSTDGGLSEGVMHVRLSALALTTQKSGKHVVFCMTCSVAWMRAGREDHPLCILKPFFCHPEPPPLLPTYIGLWKIPRTGLYELTTGS